MIGRAAGAAVLLAGLAAPAAHACSVVSTYRVPTPLDLAAKADTIVVGTIVGAYGDPADRWKSGVVIRPTALLKGARMPDRVELPGAEIVTDPKVVVTRSAPRELRRANPDTGAGACVRVFFRKDMQLVLFLSRDAQGRLTPYRSAFSRDAEDVAGRDALWVKAVRDYAAIAAHPPASWGNRLRSRIKVLRRSRDADTRAIAADMAVELAERQAPSVPGWSRR